MQKNSFLGICLKKIEKKLQWGPASNWPSNLFKQLSDLIYQKTQIQLSESSLRRIFGKTEYAHKYNPQTETLNALAKFLDYQDWTHFVQQHHHKKKSFFISLKTVIFPAIGLIAILILLWFIFIKNREKNQDIKPFFQAENIYGTNTPHSVIIKYQIPEKGDSFFVDFNDQSVLHRSKLSKTYLPPGKSTLTHTYYHNRYYDIRIFKGKQVLKTIPVLIKTNGWEGLIEQNKKIMRYSEKQIMQANTMDISIGDLIKRGIDTNQVYYTYYRNFRDYGVSMNNFSFRTSFTTSYHQDQLDCPHLQISLMGNQGRFFLTFMPKGCNQFVFLQLGEESVKGVHADLSAFCRDITRRAELLLKVENSIFQVYYNDKNIYTNDVKKTPGYLYGIRYEMKGSLKVHDYKITRLPSQ